jgi:hypothetical protein
VSLEACIKILKPHLTGASLKSLQESTNPEDWAESQLKVLGNQREKSVNLIIDSTVAAALKGDQRAVKRARIERGKEFDRVDFRPGAIESPEAEIQFSLTEEEANDWFDDFQKKWVNAKKEEIEAAKPKTSEDKHIQDLFGRKHVTIREKVVDSFESVRTKQFWDEKIAQILDRLHPIKVYLSDRVYMLHKAPSGSHLALGTFLKHGMFSLDKSGALRIDTKNKGFLSFLDSLDDYDKFFKWVAAKRAEELDKQGREFWLVEGERDRIFKWAGGKDNPKFETASKELEKFNKNILDVAEQAGLIDPVQRKAWEQSYYVPFYRIFEDTATREEFLKGPRKNNRFISAQIKKLKGAEIKPGDPLENLLQNWMHLVNESMRNIARSEAFEFAKESDSDLIQELSKTDMDSYISVKDEKGNRITYVHPKTQETALMFQRKGKPVYFKVNNQELFNALSNINVRQFDGLVAKILTTPKRWLTYSATFGPAFRIANAIRDTLQVSLIEKSFVPFWDTAKGVVQVWNESPEYIKYMSSGFAFGSRHIQVDNPKIAAKYIERLVKKEGKSVVSRILDTPRKLLAAWDHIGEVSEVAARTQLYSNLIGDGKSHLESAGAAKDTLDFGMSGSSSAVQMLIQTVPFLNARMQGAYRLGRALSDKESRKNFLIRGSMLTAASMALWFLHRDDEEYKELEDWDKWTYYHFWVGDKHFRIPKPFEVGAIFSSLPETLLDVLYGNEETKHIAEYMGHTATETFSVGVPQLFKPIMEQWANKLTFTGRPIVSEHLKGLEAREQKEPWTSETLQLIGDKLNISPKRAEALLRGYFSTLGAFIVGGSDIVVRNVFEFPEKPTMKVDDYPLVGRFIKQKDPARYTKQQTWFYDTFNKIDKTVRTINHYKKLGEYEKARKLATDRGDQYKFRKLFVKYRNRLSDINRRIKRILASKTMASDKKKERIDLLLKKRNALLKRVYSRYNK